MCQNHDMVVSHAVVGDFALLLTSWDSFNGHLNLSTGVLSHFAPSKCGCHGRELNLRLELGSETPRPAKLLQWKPEPSATWITWSRECIHATILVHLLIYNINVRQSDIGSQKTYLCEYVFFRKLLRLFGHGFTNSAFKKWAGPSSCETIPLFCNFFFNIK